MIRAFIALNADAYVIRKSILDLPSSIMDEEYMQCMLSDFLVMTTMDIVQKCLPPHIAKVSRKSLLAENPNALATMAASLDPKNVGNIGILANDDILYAMDAIGMSYELVVVYPLDTKLPHDLTMGKSLIESQECGKYSVHRYQQSVSEASDVQIANYIDGMETYFNLVDNMDKRDKDAVDKIARGVQMLNRAIQRESAEDNVIGDSYGDVGDMDVAEEIDHIWDTLQMVGDQMIDTSDMIIANQRTIDEVLQFLKNNPQRNSSNRINMLSEEIDGLRHQLGSHIEETLANETPKRDPLVWIVLGISVIALVVSLINLCL